MAPITFEKQRLIPTCLPFASLQLLLWLMPPDLLQADLRLLLCPSLQVCAQQIQNKTAKASTLDSCDRFCLPSVQAMGELQPRKASLEHWYVSTLCRSFSQSSVRKLIFFLVASHQVRSDSTLLFRRFKTRMLASLTCDCLFAASTTARPPSLLPSPRSSLRLAAARS